jgi:hypothetical protein
MIEPANGSPLGGATVTLKGVTYRLRWNTLAELTADSLGVNIRDMFNGLRENNVGQLTAFFKMFSAMVAHQFYPAEPPSPQRLALLLDEIEDDEERKAVTKRMCQAVGDTLMEKLKASAQKTKLRETAPAPAEPSLQ